MIDGETSPVVKLLIEACAEASQQGYEGADVLEGVTTLYSYFLERFVDDLPAFFEQEAHRARFEAANGVQPGPPRLVVVGGVDY